MSAEPFRHLFHDTSEHTLDKKFRLFMPKRFQDGFERDAEGNLVVWITRGQGGCLNLMSERSFHESMEGLGMDVFAPEEALDLQRLMLKDAARVALDASGRLLLGERQRKLVELEENEEGKSVVVLAGAGKRIELWPLRQWQEEEARLNAKKDALFRFERRGGAEG
jgi:MraZ protein